MDAGKSHLIASILPCQVFPVNGLRCQRTCKLRNGNILLPRQKGRIGEGPDILRARKCTDRLPDLSAVGLQRKDSPLGRGLGTGVDLYLVFREITGNMAVIRKRMRGMCH